MLSITGVGLKYLSAPASATGHTHTHVRITDRFMSPIIGRRLNGGRGRGEIVPSPTPPLGRTVDGKQSLLRRGVRRLKFELKYKGGRIDRMKRHCVFFCLHGLLTRQVNYALC